MTRKYDSKYGLEYLKFFGISIAETAVWIFFTPPFHGIFLHFKFAEDPIVSWVSDMHMDCPAICRAAEHTLHSLLVNPLPRFSQVKKKDLEVGYWPRANKDKT